MTQKSTFKIIFTTVILNHGLTSALIQHCFYSLDIKHLLIYVWKQGQLSIYKVSLFSSQFCNGNMILLVGRVTTANENRNMSQIYYITVYFEKLCIALGHTFIPLQGKNKGIYVECNRCLILGLKGNGYTCKGSYNFSLQALKRR